MQCCVQYHVDGLMQDCSNSSMLAMELHVLQSFTKSSMLYCYLSWRYDGTHLSCTLSIPPQVVYYGKVHHVVDHFSTLNLRCEPHYNPADFLCKRTELEIIIANPIGWDTDSTLIKNGYYDFNCLLSSDLSWH